MRLRERVIRLKDPNCHAEYPPSRTRRLIANVRIIGVDGDVILVAANFIIHRFRRNDLVARVRRPLPLQAPPRRRRLKIAERRAILDAEELGLLGSVSFIL